MGHMAEFLYCKARIHHVAFPAGYRCYAGFAVFRPEALLSSFHLTSLTRIHIHAQARASMHRLGPLLHLLMPCPAAQGGRDRDEFPESNAMTWVFSVSSKQASFLLVLTWGTRLLIS